jgi:hypothetical protein
MGIVFKCVIATRGLYQDLMSIKKMQGQTWVREGVFQMKWFAEVQRKKSVV